MLINCGPHQTNMGKRELRQIPTATRKLCGHCWGGPSGVLSQSKARTIAAISPRPLMAASAARSSPGIEVFKSNSRYDQSCLGKAELAVHGRLHLEIRMIFTPQTPDRFAGD